MYVYGIKRKGNDLLICLFFAALFILPAIPSYVLWTLLDPMSFLQKLLSFAVIAFIMYPTLIGIEFLLLKLFD